MTPALQKQIETLERRIRQLAHAKREVEEALEEQKAETFRLHGVLESQKHRLDDFKYRSKITNIVGQLSEHPDATELKAKIDEHVREIDHCIAFLAKEL